MRILDRQPRRDRGPADPRLPRARASRASPSTPTSTARQPHVLAADQAPSASARAPARESYLDRTRCSTRRAPPGADAVHPGYGFLAENAGFAARGRGRRPDLDRPAAGRRSSCSGSKTAARELARAGRRAGGPGAASRWRTPPSPRRSREHGRLPDPAQGGRRRRRQGDARRARAPRGRRGASTRAALGGQGVLRRRPRLRREAHRAPAPHRGPDPRRPPRQPGPPRRARVLAPAPPPEGVRGVPVAGGRRRAARAQLGEAALAVARAAGYRSAGRSSSCSRRRASSTSSR